MDKLSCHHYEGGQILEERFSDISVELLYTFNVFARSNPHQFCFSKIRLLVNDDLVGRSEQAAGYKNTQRNNRFEIVVIIVMRIAFNIRQLQMLSLLRVTE